MCDAKRPATFQDVPNNIGTQWWKDASLRKHIFYSVGCMLCPFYLGYDQSLLTGLQALPQWNAYFDNPSGALLGAISACIFLPAIVLSFVSAWVCNTWGRKPTVIIGAVFVVAGGVWNGLAKDTLHFMLSRVIMGIGGSFAKTAAPILLQETAHPKLRATMGSMYYGFYYVGSLLSAIMCIIGLGIQSEWSWRFPCICAIIGPVGVILILLNAPESPRFLVKKGKLDEALSILAKYHANGDENDELVQWEFEEIKVAIQTDAQSNEASYLDFSRTRGNRHRLLVCLTMAVGVNWVGNGIVSYYLAPILKSVGVRSAKQLVAINAGLAAWNLIVSESAGLKAEKLGRRPLFLTSTTGMIFCYSFVMGFSAGFAKSGNTTLGVVAIPFLFLFYAFYNIAWTTLNYSYCAEIMPYQLRAKGLALYLAVQQVANTFNQFVNPIALENIAWKYYAVYIVIDCFYVGLIYCYYPETKSLSIEEISQVFDDGSTKAYSHGASVLGTRAQRDEEQVEHGSKPSATHIEVVQSSD